MILLFVAEATPGFELGKKGFAVPRLTARPCRQNDTKYWIGSISSIDSILQHTISKTKNRKTLLFLLKKKCGFSFTKAKNQDKWEPLTLTIDCEFINDSWIKIEN